MSDEIFRPRRAPETEHPSMEPASPHFAKPDENFPPAQAPFSIQGNPPPEFLAALQNQQRQVPPQPQQNFTADNSLNRRDSSHLKEILEGLKSSSAIYEEIQLPSKGRFYNGQNGPVNGILSVRPMTGEEEQILATPRFVRKGQAINMIFQKCIKEQFRPEQFLTIDRTYLLIYLRGISYTPSYDVEIKCVECDKKFSTTIDLNELNVETCPDDYGPTLQDVLPTSKLPFSYRLASGQDEQDIQDYRDRRIKTFGDNSVDDSLIYRTALLLDNIDGIVSKQELQVLLKNLPINDVSYVRNCINDPPFGVDTNVEILCPSCLQDFEIDLPLESNFFFPRRKKTKTQA